MTIRRPRTLRGRLAFFYAALLAITLIAYSGVVFFLATKDDAESKDPGEIEEVRNTRRRILLALAFGYPAALVLAVGGVLWIARRELLPVSEVVRVASELGVERLERRIPRHDEACQEIDQLVATLNAMLGRLEHSVSGMRRFTADASHELRTPLAVLMGDIEVALRRPREAADLRATLEGTLEELGQLARLVDSLLTLARSDAGELPLQPIPCDAAQVVRQVLDLYEEIASERAIAVSCECPGGIMVQADPLWLGRAFANLVDNACKFTPRDGQVAIAIERHQDRVQLVVSDTGPGLSPEERARVFERFYRGATARASSEGFGLGLPLARDIVRALGGDLLVAPRPEGGTRCWIELPSLS